MTQILNNVNNDQLFCLIKVDMYFLSQFLHPIPEEVYDRWNAA